MKKNGFMEGAIIATIAIILSKVIGILYVIPFKNIVGDQGGALYGYAYNIYNIFLIIGNAGIPFAISKLTSEYIALNKEKEKTYMFKTSRLIILLFSIISFLICFFGAGIIASLITGDATLTNSPSDIIFVLRSVSFAILVVPLLSIYKGYLQGNGYIAPASISEVIEQFIRVLVIIVGSYLTLKVFNLSLAMAIGVAVFGACVGAVVAYLYLYIKTRGVKEKKINTNSLTKEEKKDVVLKILLYSLPFIIVNVTGSIYTSTDMVLLIRGLNNLGFTPEDIDSISSVFTTWAVKLHSIVTSIAVGLAISLIPSLAKSNAKGDYEDINDKINKTIQMFLYIAMPLAIFMSIFASKIWFIFFGISKYGPIIFRYSVLVAAVDALYLMINNGLQGLNKSKLIYISVGLGLGINLLLDLPLMYLFNNLGLYPYYGTITATLIGYIISISISLIVLKHKYNLHYKNTWIKLPKILFVYAIMIVISLLFYGIIESVYWKVPLIIYIGIFGILLLIPYYLLNKKELESLLGKKISSLIGRK